MVTLFIHKWHFLDGYMLLQLLLQTPEEIKMHSVASAFRKDKRNITNNYAKVLKNIIKEYYNYM